MPRKPRIDAPGLLYHVIARGIERGVVFKDSEDYDFFLSHLGEILKDTDTAIYAFALMPNHFHLLLRRVNIPISTVMSRLLTKYALYYNKRHKRAGHLFQNRYKAIICEEEPYLLELIRYIHLNPFRAGLTKTPKEMESYRYSGHGFLMGKLENDWYDIDPVLSYFSNTQEKARNAYMQFVIDGSHMGKRRDLTGGGLKRSLGLPEFYPKTRIASDERILGQGDFVRNLVEINNKPLYPDREEDLQKLYDQINDRFSVTKTELLGRSRMRHISEARAFAAIEMIKSLGFSASESARELSISKSAIVKIMRKR